MEIEHKGEVFTFEDLTVRQMELLSELLNDSRKTVFEELTSKAKTPQLMLNITIKISDVLHELRKRGKMALFCALCLTRKGAEWNEGQLKDHEKLFASLSYKKAEKAFTFFFTGGSFATLLIPSSLSSAPDTASEMTSAI